MEKKGIDPISYIMLVWNIQSKRRGEIEALFKDHKRPETMDLALAHYSQHPDDEDFDPSLDEWPSPLAA